MGDLLDLLGGILDIGEIYDRYGAKGCILFFLAVVVIIGIIIAIAAMLQ
jgi:hypothetical protein